MTTSSRRDEILARMRDHQYRATDRLFAKLLIGQWVLASGLAFVLSPWSVHFKLAIGLGGLLNIGPLLLIHARPGWWLTRHLTAAAQLLWSALLITITNGRSETHFHVFGSLAFLAFYRDWRVLVTGTAIVIADHVVVGMCWPVHVYGLANPEWWRVLEHASWVLFEALVLVVGCRRSLIEMREAATRQNRLERMRTIVERAVDQRTYELQETSARYRSLVENAAVIPFEVEPQTAALVYMAPQMATLLGCTPQELDAGFLARSIHADDLPRFQAVLAQFRDTDAAATDPLDYRLLTSTGHEVHVRTLFTRVANRVHGYTFDVTRQRRLELELAQAQKLESIGRLASGIAHEINTPVQYIGDSVHFATEAITDLFGVLRRQQVVVDQVLAAAPDHLHACSARDALEDADLPFLMDELPSSLARAGEGVSRVAEIVGSMKVFAHPGGEIEAVDLNRTLENTLVMAHNEYRFIADLDASYGELPEVQGRRGEIGQVLLNLVVNASHAIGSAVLQTRSRGKLTVRSRRDGDSVVISIGDTGAGIPAHLHDRIFDPFFTTKGVGQGTGQGLAIARTIVDRHRGSLTFESKLGAGTTFTVRLPIAQQQRAAA